MSRTADTEELFTAETARSLYRSHEAQLNERAEHLLSVALSEIRQAARHRKSILYHLPNGVAGSPDNLDKRDVAVVLAEKLRNPPYGFSVEDDKYGKLAISW